MYTPQSYVPNIKLRYYAAMLAWNIKISNENVYVLRLSCENVDTEIVNVSIRCRTINVCTSMKKDSDKCD